MALATSCLLLLPTGRAAACATCACGDPTLTVMGAQQPFEHRLRPSLELLHRTDAVGREGIDRVELSEQRLTLGLAYAPADWLMVSASVPLIRRQLTDASLAEETFISPGDTELRARAFIFRDRAFAPEHLIATVVGVKLPTGPLERGPTGEYREPEFQAGTGSFDPLLGVSYSHFAAPWSAYASEILYVPTPSRADWRIGMSWRGTHAVQYQLDDTWALRLGFNTRLDEKTRRDNFDEPDTGGFIAFLSPSVVISPAVDLVLNLDVHIPVINALIGHHEEGPIFTLGAAYDL